MRTYGTKHTFNAKSAGYKAHKSAKASNRRKASEYKQMVADKLSGRLACEDRDMDGADAADVAAMYDTVRAADLAHDLARVSRTEVPSFHDLKVVDLETGDFVEFSALGPVSWHDFDPNDKRQRFQVVTG